MRFGVREICDVVLKRKYPGYFGGLWLDTGAPVFYFDTLKTSSLEGAATTVYATGGRGNPRLVAWEGDKTVTFTMEDALISPQTFSILSGAGLINANENKKIYVHTTEQVEVVNGSIKLTKEPSKDADLYIMLTDKTSGRINAEILPMKIPGGATGSIDQEMAIADVLAAWAQAYNDDEEHQRRQLPTQTVPSVANGDVVYVDYYVEATSNVMQINIEAAKFGGSYYLEASTLFRDEATGADYPAEFIIPNCKVQSNFTFSMSPTGDPSTFSFTLDAFPDFTKFDKTKKVLAAIQIIEDTEWASEDHLID